ncbi:MAG: multiheme c-type cytochrome [Pirellulaceae bacterium]
MNGNRAWWYMGAMVFAATLVGCSPQDNATAEQGTASEAENRSRADASDVRERLEANGDAQPDDIAGVSEVASGSEARGTNVSSRSLLGEVSTDQAAAEEDVVAEVVSVDSQADEGERPSRSAPGAGAEASGSTGRASSAGAINAKDERTTRPGYSKGQGSGGEAREALFEGWVEPSVALLVTGRQYGYLEPCGCSGLDSQNGGLVRRGTLVQQLTQKGWPVIPIDAGNQVRRFGRQAEIKFQITVEALRTMGYEAIGFGPDDLRLPAPELVGVIAPRGNEPSRFVSANVQVFAPTFTSPYRVVERGGKKIGITAILGKRNRSLINNSDVIMQSAEAGIQEVWPRLEQSDCDLYVLISHATTEESIALGKKFPQFQLVITTGGAGEPKREPLPIEGTESQMIQVGTKGMFAGLVALFDDPVQPLRYQRIPLDSRFPDSKEMLRLFVAYQNQIKAAGLENLGIKPQPLASGLEFVGSKLCGDCHEREYKIWKEGNDGAKPKHAHAYETLQHPPNDRGGIPRNFDPECISCHVVGWNPQKYFPYESGFLSLEETPHLTDVGCENCHGPGSKHVAAEEGELDLNGDEIDRIRDQVWLDLSNAEEKCLECHDLDNSPAFQEEGAFDRYWEKIAH